MDAPPLTTGAALGHIRRMAGPAALGLLCNMLYNITDTFYAGWLGTGAQAALAFSFPLFFLQLSLCVGLSQAVAARAAAAVGGKLERRASRLAGQSAVLAAAACAFIWPVLLPSADFVLGLLGAEGEVRKQAAEYSRIIFLGAPAFLGAFALSGVLQAVGNTTAFRNGIAAAAAANIILDPALMFGWFGLPALGMGGIACATVLSQLGCAAYMLRALSGTPIARRWRRQFLRPRRRLLAALAALAAPSAGRMLCINAGFFIVVSFLGYFGADAVAGYGIALRVEQLFLVPTIGLEIAMLAYAGQNFGGGRPARIAAAYVGCLKKGAGLMAVAAAVLVLGGGFLTGLFNSEPEVIRHGRNYLLLAAASGPLYIVISISGAVFLAAGRGGLVLAASALRLAVAPAVLAYVLAVKLDMKIPGVWLSLFACNAAAAAFLHKRCRRLLRGDSRLRGEPIKIRP